MTTEPEMVERVARVIAGIAFEETHEGDAESEWPRVVHIARAAIEATIPTDAELQAAAEEYADAEDQGEKWGWLVGAFKSGAEWQALRSSLIEGDGEANDPDEAVAESIGMAPAAAFAPSIARQQGYTGNACSTCGSVRMTVAGHCEVCADCGTTTGCS